MALIIKEHSESAKCQELYCNANGLSSERVNAVDKSFHGVCRFQALLVFKTVLANGGQLFSQLADQFTVNPRGPLPATRTRNGDQSLIAPLSSSYTCEQTPIRSVAAAMTNLVTSLSCKSLEP